MRLNAKKIAEILNVSRMAIVKRAQKEGWPFVESAGVGKREKLYIVEELPENVKRILMKQETDGQNSKMNENEVWLTSDEVAELLGITRVAVYKSKKFKYIYVDGTGRGGKEIRIALSSLPEDAQIKYVNKNKQIKDLEVVKNKLAPTAIFEIEKLKVHANIMKIGNTIMREEEKEELILLLDIIREAKEYAGVPKRKHLENLAKKYGRGRSTIERYIKIYNEGGIEGLKKIVIKARDRGFYKWSEEAIEFLRGVYLKGIKDGSNISKEKAYESVVKEAKKRGWGIGSLSSAYKYINDINPLLLKYAKGGKQALDNIFYIARDYRDLRPFQVVVGDQHKFDFWVRDCASGEIFRPMGYFFVDARTRLIYGFAFSGKKYSSYTIGLALRMGVYSFGLPEGIYTDNGKPEISKYVSSVANDIKALGSKTYDVIDLYKTKDGYYAVENEDGEVVDIVEDVKFHRKARPYNAKAKLIERFFKTFRDILANEVPGLVVDKSDLTENRKRSEERLKDMAKSGKLLTYEEFICKVFEAAKYYNNRKHTALGRSPVEELMHAVKYEGFKPTLITHQDKYNIDKLFFARATRKVHRGRVQVDGIIFEPAEANVDEGLFALPDKTEVEIRFNPFDINKAYAVLPDGKEQEITPIVCSSMIDKELTSSLMQKKREMIKAVADRYHEYINGIPDILEYSKC